MLKAPGSHPGQVGACGVGVGARFHIWWCILILNKREITHLVVHIDLEVGVKFDFLTLISLF